MQLTVQIMRYVDDPQPGLVECEFVDAEGRHHTIVDQVPVVTCDLLDATSVYPQTGGVAYKELKRWQDADGRELVRISTEPFGVESTDGLSEFTVLATLLTPDYLSSSLQSVRFHNPNNDENQQELGEFIDGDM